MKVKEQVGADIYVDDTCPSPKSHPTLLTTARALATGQGTPGDSR